MTKLKNVLSLFDGLSGGQIALTQNGINYDTYYASEVDKYAIQVTQKNFPNTVQLGDVTKWQEWDIDWSSIDLLHGGSPCQGFSNAGKGLNFEDPRSKLFFVFVDILNHIKKHNSNVKFMLENVRMKKEWLDVISEQLGVEPIMINSALVSGQNRVRFYWTNIANVQQPEDREIYLQDILEKQVEESYYLTESQIKNINRNFGSKGKIIDLENDSKIEKISYPSRINQKYGKIKSPTLTAAMGTGGGNVPVIVKDGRIRKFTHIECERLMTVPDGYTTGVASGQRYKMLGNGWTIEVIKHIYKNLLDNE